MSAARGLNLTLARPRLRKSALVTGIWPKCARNVRPLCKSCRPAALYAGALFASLVMDRVATFKTFSSRAPADPFPRYGLAMEYKGSGALDEAWVTFEELLTKFPDYVPTYLMAGQTLVALGRTEQAVE